MYSGPRSAAPLPSCWPRVTRADRSSGVVEHVPPRGSFVHDQSGRISERSWRFGSRLPDSRRPSWPSISIRADYLTAHPELVSPLRRHQAQRRTEAAPRRDPDPAGRVRTQRDLGADAGFGGQRGPSHPEGPTRCLWLGEIAGAKTAIVAGVGHVGTIQDPARGRGRRY